MQMMKNSGVKWIGEIPQEWSLCYFKNIVAQNDGGIWGEEPEENSSFVLRSTEQTIDGKWDIVTPAKRDISAISNVEYYVCKKGDLLITKSSGSANHIGKTTIVDEKVASLCCYYSNFLQRVRLKSGHDPRYYWYILNSNIAREQFKYSQNSTSGLGNINAKDIANLIIPNISMDIQWQIADYLDVKCAKIDALIAKQQEIIEKLKAYKLSVITEAVTKGLNPNVPMKDSGVDFMGKIPGHWEMVRMKFLLSHIIDCPHETPEYSADGEYLVIRTADQDFGFLRPDENMYRLNENEYQNRIRRLPLDKDDIVYGREGERWGLACLVPESNRYCLGQRMMQFRCNTDMIFPAYAMWALNSRYVYLQGSVDTIGSTSPHVNISTMRNYNIPTPPLDEQQEIVRYINEKAAAIEKTIQKRTMLIDKMTAYKKSLIYEVVTGKREVI